MIKKNKPVKKSSLMVKVMKGGFLTGLAIAGVHAASALTLDKIIQYKHISYKSSRISPELNGYKIAFVTDIHSLPAEKIISIAKRIRRDGCDLLLIGGDFPHSHGAANAVMEILGKIPAKDGIYGVCGNHDHLSDLKEAMANNNAVLLDNQGIRIRPGLYLAGIQDKKYDQPDIKKAISGADKDDFVLLLSHNPDQSMEPAASGADLILSGHTHGGQICFFGVWAPALTFFHTVSAYGQKFRSGFAKSDFGPVVFVSNGVGSHHGIPRVFARPQVIYLTLQNQYFKAPRSSKGYSLSFQFFQK